ncbi:hypothetical protein HPB47_008678 [Ixodes persulcatus]|uniref:Uncharacterized protein n=1 Tax=Ixodes persulcatus TaxID=34615 RepID=A0AC60P453_IXOPE|nr:hypothetical protein HPB47_008678 [Ixodes persulcatus]
MPARSAGDEEITSSLEAKDEFPEREESLDKSDPARDAEDPPTGEVVGPAQDTGGAQDPPRGKAQNAPRSANGEVRETAAHSARPPIGEASESEKENLLETAQKIEVMSPKFLDSYRKGADEVAEERGAGSLSFDATTEAIAFRATADDSDELIFLEAFKPDEGLCHDSEHAQSRVMLDVEEATGCVGALAELTKARKAVKKKAKASDDPTVDQGRRLRLKCVARKRVVRTRSEVACIVRSNGRANPEKSEVQAKYDFITVLRPATRMLTREQKAAMAAAAQMNLLTKVTEMCDSVMRRLAHTPGQQETPPREPRPHLTVPVYTRYDDVRSVADFLGELQTYHLASGASEAFIVDRILPLALQASARCWLGSQASFTSLADFQTRLREEFLPAGYATQILRELEARTQHSDKSLVRYIRVMQELFRRADPNHRSRTE